MPSRTPRRSLVVPEPVVVSPMTTPALKVKKVRRRKRKWMTLPMGGSVWTIWLVDERTLTECAGDDQGAEGLMNDSASEILILDTVEPTRRIVVLIHEILHAALNPVGAGSLIPHIFGCPYEKIADIEENVVSHLAPVLAGALGNLLKLPKVRVTKPIK